MTKEEAINEIRSWYFLNGKEIEAVQTLIPELRESEDEEIYREIYSIVHYHYERKTALFVHSRDRNEMLRKWEKAKSYLEKLKEQKPVEWSEEDGRLAEEALDMIKSNGGWGRSDDAVKQVSNWFNNRFKLLRPQPKQEWSEKDEEKSAIDLIAKERKRQISKGFNWRHDDEHNCHQLSDAAIVYAAPGPLRYQVMNWWPWDKKWLKEDDSFTTEGRIRELIKAGALIVAEIERLQRTINNYDKK